VSQTKAQLLDGSVVSVSFGAGSAAAPSINYSANSTTGIYFPGSGQLAISTNGTQRLTVDTAATTSTLPVVHPLGAVGTPSITFTGDLNTGIYSPAADTIAFVEGGAEAMRIDSSGRLGLGTSSPGCKLDVVGGAIRTDDIFTLYKNAADALYIGPGTIVTGGASTDVAFRSNQNGSILFSTNGTTERMRLDSSGRLGIGTTSPNTKLHVQESGVCYLNVNGQSTNFYVYSSSSGGGLFADAAVPITFTNSSTEKARIDSSGRLLVGTSSSASVGDTQYARLQVRGNTFDSTYNAILSLQRGQAATSFGGDTFLGTILFSDSTGGEFARIDCRSDGASGTNDYPGRLVFSTTLDGAASPTERMRINNQGSVSFIKTVAASFGNVGVTIYGAGTANPGSVDITRDGGQPLAVNRLTNDGALIEFYQDTTIEGTISVSGTTVSYNGAHLSRWSQLPNGATREEILRGTVLSNIDEMCGWGEEDNEQLNRMKVSDVEGDKNVSGVFQCWDDDDDTYTDDFYCAMTGDFIIRIAEGVTVDCGDLLVSAGDGTAKPQDDDIIRSKTVAKVTSTHVTCTYEDGSYCVPCVLMAC